MPSPIMRRLRAIEAQRGPSVKRNPVDMMDDEIDRALHRLNPALGALNGLTDQQIENRLQELQERSREDTSEGA